MKVLIFISSLILAQISFAQSRHSGMEKQTQLGLKYNQEVSARKAKGLPKLTFIESSELMKKIEKEYEEDLKANDFSGCKKKPGHLITCPDGDYKYAPTTADSIQNSLTRSNDKDDVGSKNQKVKEAKVVEKQ